MNFESMSICNQSPSMELNRLLVCVSADILVPSHPHVSLITRVSSILTNGSSQEGEEGVWEEHEVRLRRGEQGGFGFAVTGVEEGDVSERGVRVEDVVAGGPAEGKLKLGDTIVRIGGRHLAQLQYGEAIQVNTILPN